MMSPLADIAGASLIPVRYRVALWPRGATGPTSTVEARVRTVEVVEEIGRPYRVRATLVHGPDAFDEDELVGGEFALSWGRRLEARHLTAVVLRAARGPDVPGAACTIVEAGPALSLLALTCRSRVWQDLTAPEIVELVARETLGPRGRLLDAAELRGVYPTLDYCVQYQERDLDFVHRLLEEAGITYRFETRGDVEAVVLADDVGAAPRAEGPSVVTLEPTGNLDLADDEGIAALAPSRALHASRVTRAAWDFKAAEPASLFHDHDLVDDGDAFLHALHDDRRLVEPDVASPLLDDGRQVARIEAERLATSAQAATGSGVVAGFAAGATFELHDPRDQVDAGPYLLTRVVHRGDDPSVVAASAGRAPTYENTFECVPASQPYRPPRRVAKPRVHGPHTATVIGPAGEAIHTDRFGRVQVAMHWDREVFLRGESPSCWLRVAQSWAGNGFGALFIPRVGMEVVVSFQGGDPDRPLCTGCLYNGKNAPPQSLPEHKSRSTFRTSSTPGDDGYNELTFEDEADREEIYLRAQRNLREVVRANHSTRVGVDQQLSVGRDRSVTVDRSQRTEIGKDRDDEVRGNATEVIAGSRDVTVMGSDVVGGVHGARLYVGGTYTVEAEQCIRLQCGGSTLELTPAGVRIYALQVQVHGGPSSVHLLPTGIQATGPAVTVVGGNSLLHLAEGAEVRGGSRAVVQQGASHLTLDGTATVAGASTTIEGVAAVEVKGEACTVAGTTTAISGEAVSVSGTQATVLDGGGGTVKLAGGLVELG